MRIRLEAPAVLTYTLAQIVVLGLFIFFGLGLFFQALHDHARANRFNLFFGFKPEKEHRRQAEVDAQLKYKKKTCLGLLGKYVEAAEKEDVQAFRLKIGAEQICRDADQARDIATEFKYR